MTLDPKTCTVLYKILTTSEKDSLPAKGWIGTQLDQKDGFLHLSTSQQLSGTLDRFFSKDSGADDQLYLLVLPRENIPNDKLQFDSAAGTLFGHIYGTIDPETDFMQTISIHRDANSGKFQLDDRLQF